MMLSVTPLLTIPELMHLSSPNVGLGKMKEYKIEVECWKKALREVFPEQIEAFEKKIAEVRAGKSDFKIMTSKEGS